MKNDMQDNKDFVAGNEQAQERPQTNEAPVASSTDSSAQPQRSKKKLWMIVGVVVLILALVAAAASYFLMQKSDQTDKDADPLAAATKFESPQALVDEVEPELQGVVMEVKASTGVSATDSNGNYAYGAPVYRASGAKFGVLPLTVTGSAYKGNSVAAAENYAALKQFFETNKFVKKYSAVNAPGTTSDVSAAVNYVAYAEYESSDLLCAIRHVDASSTSVGAHVASIGCSDKDSYGEAARKLQPFYGAYIASGSDVSDDLVFGFLRETDGADGYKHAVIYQEDDKQFDDGVEAEQLTGLYVQEPGKSDWKYFTVTTVDSVPVCSDYKTDVLKNAFKGYECYDDKSQKTATVQ